MISTRAMEYIEQVQEDLQEAVRNKVDIRVIMRKSDSLTPEDAIKQNENLVGLREILGDESKIRYSSEVEIRGAIMDPDSNGRALFLVEEEGIPFFLREAALTNHPGVVKALASMFDLKWQFDTE